MKTKIKFGTDGFRGIIAKDFTFETVDRIIKAIVLYLRSLKSPKKTVIVGFDPRFEAADFAKFCADLLKEYGFRVILSSKVVPTPIVAYCAKYYPDSIGAIMLTASHNPKNYQGIKFIPDFGGPAPKETTDEILKYLDKEVSKTEIGSIKVEDLENDYFKHLEKIIDFKAIQNNSPKIIYDGLFSSSIGYFDKILDKYKIPYLSYNMHHDPDFGGGLPEPKDKFLKNRKQGYIVVANDGDADRYGVIDEDGSYVHPNIVMALLLKYLAKKSKGKMIKTVGVSSLIDVVAKKLKIETITTPVGFKWLSEAMRKNDCILAGEDSGGLSIGSHIPEKDGLLANLLIIEMLSSENKTLVELQKEILDFCSCRFYTTRVDKKVSNDNEINKLEEKFSKFDEIAGLKIVDKLSIDGKKLFLDNSLSWVLIRKSGTEPLLRFYIEADSLDRLNKIKDFIEANISDI